MDQQSFTMLFGALVAVAGIGIFVFKQQEAGANTIRVLGFEVTLSTPGLVIFVVGAAIFSLPLLIKKNRANDDPPIECSVERFLKQECKP